MRRYVAIGLIVLAVVLIVFDVFLVINDTQGDTYSEIIRDCSYRLAILPWCMGGILSHWFWNGHRYSNLYTWLAVLAALAILETLNLAFGITDPLMSMILGVLSGRLVWAMAVPSD